MAVVVGGMIDLLRITTEVAVNRITATTLEITTTLEIGEREATLAAAPGVGVTAGAPAPRDAVGFRDAVGVRVETHLATTGVP